MRIPITPIVGNRKIVCNLLLERAQPGTGRLNRPTAAIMFTTSEVHARLYPSSLKGASNPLENVGRLRETTRTPIVASSGRLAPRNREPCQLSIGIFLRSPSRRVRSDSNSDVLPRTGRRGASVPLEE